MASQVSETVNTTRKLITGYVRFNKDENIESVITTLKSFNAKYSHHVGYVFFSLDQQRLSDLSTQLKFRISRFESKSEYSCPADVATLITDQRDSFLRVHYHTDRSVLEFLSRTTSSVHYNLVQRLFKRAGVEFSRDNYSSFRSDRQPQTRMRRQDTEIEFTSVDQTSETHQETHQETQQETQARTFRNGRGTGRASGRGRTNYMGKAKYTREGRQQFRQQQQDQQVDGVEHQEQRQSQPAVRGGGYRGSRGSRGSRVISGRGRQARDASA